MVKSSIDNASLSAFRVFETLKCLIKSPADVNDIIKYLENLEQEEGKAYSKAVVYKYLTTLKFAGVNIQRKKCKYEVTDLPFKIKLDKESMYAIEILNKILDFTPENDLVKDLQTFIYSVKMRCSSDNIDIESIEKELANQFATHKANESQVNTLRVYEKYCKDKLKLQIEYYDVFGEKCINICEPIEAKFEDSSILLYAYCENPNQFLELNSNQIIDIKQTPQSCKNVENYITYSTVFTLSGRLAKRYTPRPLEIRMDNGLSDDIKTFSNKDESKDSLYLRLMRYSESCKLNSPKKDRETMRKLIAETLKNYGIEVEK